MTFREHCLMVVGGAVTCVLWTGLTWWLRSVWSVENGAAQDRMSGLKAPATAVTAPGFGPDLTERS